MGGWAWRRERDRREIDLCVRREGGRKSERSPVTHGTGLKEQQQNLIHDLCTSSNSQAHCSNTC